MPKFRERVAGELASAASSAIAAKVSGDANDRISVDAGGTINWGTGSAAADTNLYRSDVSVLKTDDVFQAALGVVTATSAGAPSSALADGGLAVDTTNNAFYFRSGGIWRTPTGGAGTGGVATFTIPGTLVVGVGAVRWYAPQSLTISNVIASVGTPSSGASIIFDVNKGTSASAPVTIFTTQANRPTIAAAANVDTSSAPDVTSLSPATGDYLTVDIDQVGTTVYGSDAVIQIVYS